MEVIRTYQKVPPQAFQDVVVTQANTYHVVRDARFEGNQLVAESVFKRHGSGWESLTSMLDGLEFGFKAAFPKPAPWYFKVTTRTLRPQYKAMTERQVFEALHLDYYSDELPAAVFKTKVETERFATFEDADKRHTALYQRAWPNSETPDRPNYDKDVEVLF